MSIDRMCSVLGLPLGRWPPDHYTLLGLEPSDADAARIEESVLEKMERLRPYQLAYSDAVTDAMNRLAQALVCLTDPDARRAYDASLGHLSTPAPPPAPREVESSEAYPLAQAELIAPAPIARPVGRRIAVRSRGDDRRRELYRRLAGVRRLREAWHTAGLTLADAVSPLRQPMEAVAFVAALWDIRRLTDGDTAPPVGHTGQAGALVGALARQPHVLHTFRHLLPNQRTALAADWRAGADRLEEMLRTLHGQLRRPPRVSVRRVVRRTSRSLMTDRLDLTLFVLGLTALGIALFRSR